MLRKQAVFDRETFLTLPDLPPRLKLWGEDRELEDFLVKKAFMINPIPSSVARADGEVKIAVVGSGPAGLGSASPRRLKMIRDDAKGVYYAKDFLTYVTKEMLEQNTSVPADTAGKDVVIIGGGDTGIDCAAVAFAQGARSILQLELRECEMTGKTQDGFCELVSSDPTLSYGTMLQDVLYDDNGFVKGVRIAKVEWISSASGSLPKPQLIEGSESEIPAQLLLLATGFTGPEPAVFSTFAFNKTPVGTIAKGSGYFDTSRAGVFAAGDARRGQGVVEWAFAEGRNAAVECAEYLHALKK